MTAAPNQRRLLFAALLLGAVLRVLSLVANHGFPHGDVHLDAATAESLAAGRGFWTPWEEGAAFRADEIGESPATFGHPADQHGPLWPLLAVPFVYLTGGDGVLALQFVSYISGLLTILFAWFVFGRFHPAARAPVAFAFAVALPLCDYSGNGSLYSAQVAGMLALPLVAGNLDSIRRNLFAGGILGALFLLNYQCVVLIPAFALAVIFTKGLRVGIFALSCAGAGCLAVTTPWFIRNYLAFGDPAYTTNIQFVVRHLNRHAIDTSGPRVLLEDQSTRADFWNGIAEWGPRNLCHWITTIHLALPLFSFFAPGGFLRMLQKDASGKRPFAGAFLVFSLLAIVLISCAWPVPKARYMLPMLGIITGAAIVEAAAGVRASISVATLIITIIVAFMGGLSLSTGQTFPWVRIQAANQTGFPALEMSLLLPLIVIPFLMWIPRIARRASLILIIILAAHGGLRVAISLNRPFSAWMFGIEKKGESMFGPPTATFYEILGGPFTEGFEYAELIELKRIAMQLKAEEVSRVVAPVEMQYFFDGEVVTLPSCGKRFDRGVLQKTMSVFGADGLVLPAEYLGEVSTREPLINWALISRATMVYGGNDQDRRFVAFKFPKAQ